MFDTRYLTRVFLRKWNAQILDFKIHRVIGEAPLPNVSTIKVVSKFNSETISLDEITTNLVDGLRQAIVKYKPQDAENFYAYPTEEFEALDLVVPQNDLSDASDPYFTVYETERLSAKPPELLVWVVVRGRFDILSKELNQHEIPLAKMVVNTDGKIDTLEGSWMGTYVRV